MVLGVFSLIAIGGVVAFGLAFDLREQKRHKEHIEWSKQLSKSIDEFSDAVQQLQIDATEMESVKRWMKGTINQLVEHGNKLDDYMDRAEADKPEQLSMSEKIDMVMRKDDE